MRYSPATTRKSLNSPFFVVSDQTGVAGINAAAPNLAHTDLLNSAKSQSSGGFSMRANRERI